MGIVSGSRVPWEAWNIATFRHMHATATSPHWLVALAALLATLPLYASFALTAWQLVRSRERHAALGLTLALAIALATEAITSAFAYHPRPFAAGFGPAWMEHAANNSMPSTHVTLALTMSLIVGLRRHTGTSLALIGMSVLMAWARIYVGIHWPADMIGAVISACLSSALACALLKLVERQSRRADCFRPGQI